MKKEAIDTNILAHTKWDCAYGFYCLEYLKQICYTQNDHCPF